MIMKVRFYHICHDLNNSAYYSWQVTIWPIPHTEFGQFRICGNGLCGIYIYTLEPVDAGTRILGPTCLLRPNVKVPPKILIKHV